MSFFEMLSGDRGRDARPSIRPCLEELESRLTPSSTGTYTNAFVQVNPNFFAGTVTETITATVTNAPFFNPFTGVTTPAGTGTPTGTVFFNLNNQQTSATLNANGQATVSFTLPLVTVLTSQALRIEYAPAFVDPNPGANHGFTSVFTAPLYMNFDNVFLNATLTFGQLTPQQVQNTFNMPGGTWTGLRLYNTAQGETETYNAGLFSFTYNYVDPGVIASVNAFGFTLPGSVAAQLGAYAFFNIP